MKKVFFFVPVCLLLAGCFGEAAVPSGDPGKKFSRKIRGYKYHQDTMLATSGQAYWAQEVLSGYHRARETDIPSSIKTIEQTSCTMRPPEKGAFVAHVHVGHGQQRAPVYEFSRRQVGDRAKRLIKRYVATKKRSASVRSYRSSDGLRLINVVVAKSDQPVHLVLTSQAGVLWNIQKADTAEISGISVIGPNGAGLANVPHGTSVQGWFGRFLSSCKVLPARMPKEHWGFIRYAGEKPRRSTQKLVNENYARAGAYAGWLMKTFRLTDPDAVIDPLAVSNVLIGEVEPAHSNRIVYRSIKDATVHVSRNDYVFAANQSGYSERMTQLITDAAERAIGGKLDTLLRGS